MVARGAVYLWATMVIYVLKQKAYAMHERRWRFIASCHPACYGHLTAMAGIRDWRDVLGAVWIIWDSPVY